MSESSTKLKESVNYLEKQFRELNTELYTAISTNSKLELQQKEVSLDKAELEQALKASAGIEMRREEQNT